MRVSGSSCDGLDHDGVRTILARSGALLTQQRVIRVDLIGAKRGRRATYVVELAGPGDTVVVKCFADARRADVAAGALTALGDALGPRSRDRGVRLIGRDSNAIVYRPTTGRRLDDVILRDSPVAAGRAAARWLARLHGSTAALERTLDPDQEARTVASWLDALSCSSTGLDGALCAIRDQLARHRPIAALEPVPIHKDLHHGHLYLAPDAVTAIDFDESRLGPQGFDVAHFVVNLEVLALLSGSDRPLVAAGHFLDRYRSATGWAPGADHAWWRIYCLVKLAWQVTQGVGPPPLTRPQHRGNPLLVAAILAQRSVVRGQ